MVQHPLPADFDTAGWLNEHETRLERDGLDVGGLHDSNGRHGRAR